MECNRASVYHRHAKQCSTTYISKSTRRPGTRITGFSENTPVRSFHSFPCHVWLINGYTRTYSYHGRRKMDRQYFSDATIMHRRSFHPYQHTVFKSYYQSREIKHLYVEYHITSSSTVDNSTLHHHDERQYTNNGDSLCMYQYHMVVCLAHLCPSIHRS